MRPSTKLKKKQKKTCHSSYPNSNHLVEKSQWLSFLKEKLIFNQKKYLKITLITFLNQFLTFKNTKNRSKIQNQPRNQFLPNHRFVLGTFKIKKTPKSNFSHHMKLFETKIKFLMAGIKEMTFFSL
jgi:hypothetical protein